MNALLLALALQTYEEATLKVAALAEKAENGPSKVEVGDEFTKLMGKFPKRRIELLDAASLWYGKAWPDLDDAWKGKLRDRLARLYAPNQAGKPATLDGWGGVLGAAAKIEVVGQRVHSGAFALRFTPKNLKLGTIASSKPVAVQAGKKLEVSAWVLSDGTDGLSDGLKFVIRDQKDGFSWTCGEKIKSDSPVWVRISGETVLPEGSTSAEVQISFDSKAGVMYVDDLSINLDGKELLKTGSFEEAR